MSTPAPPSVSQLLNELSPLLDGTVRGSIGGVGHYRCALRTFSRVLIDQPNCVAVQPGPRHWDIFTTLCQQADATGNLVPDAWFAAMAIESGCEWITTDRDYARFKGLRWRPPF